MTHLKKHSLGSTDDHDTATLAELNALVSDARLIDGDNVDCLTFDTDNTDIPEEGEVCWVPDEGTLGVGMPGGNVTLNAGMETFIPRRVQNKTGADMANGDLIYISGGTGVNVRVSLAKADASATAETTIAMLTEDIDDNGKGYATTFGLVRGDATQPIDTSSWAPGTILYLSAATAGGFTDTLPEHPHYVVRIGQVFRQHATEGAILVNIEEPVCPCKIAGGDDAVWDDLRFPFSGQRLDTSSGRLDYDYFNCGVQFQANARYPDEPICMLVQMPHEWLAGSSIRPHIHWIQQGSDVPNWLLAYKVIKKNEDIGVQTDYSNFTLMPWDTNAFTHTSGDIHQLTTFGEIDMTGAKLSDCIQCVLFRDSANTSGEFTGADPSAIAEINLEFDIHYQIDSLGSRQEFTKG